MIPFNFSVIVATIFIVFFAIIFLSFIIATVAWTAKANPRILGMYLPEHSCKIYHWLSAHTADIDDLRYRSTEDISAACKLNRLQVRRGCCSHPDIYHQQDGSLELWTTYPHAVDGDNRIVT